MAFIPGISSPASEGRLYVVTEQALCVVRTSSGVDIPTGRAAGAIYLGSRDDSPCFARALQPGESPPEGSEPIPLRRLFGVLSGEDFAIAGDGNAAPGKFSPTSRNGEKILTVARNP